MLHCLLILLISVGVRGQGETNSEALNMYRQTFNGDVSILQNAACKDTKNKQNKYTIKMYHCSVMKAQITKGDILLYV